jgi:hypothetical protein
MATGEGDFQTAAEHIAEALASLERCEAWTVEWRVHATAAKVFARLGRREEAAAARNRSLKAADRIAATLAGEPALQETFQKRVAADLDETAASA